MISRAGQDFLSRSIAQFLPICACAADAPHAAVIAAAISKRRNFIWFGSPNRHSPDAIGTITDSVPFSRFKQASIHPLGVP